AVRRWRRKFPKLNNAPLSVACLTMARLAKTKVKDLTLLFHFRSGLKRVVIVCPGSLVSFRRIIKREFFEADRNGSRRRSLSSLLVCKVRIFLIGVISYRIVHISGEFHPGATGSPVAT